MWACPHCKQALQLDAVQKSWRCAGGHQFDCAREGYVNLLPANRKRSRHPGDSPQMLAARRRVHEAQLYRPLADAVEQLLSPLEEVASMLDLGCGEGYYSGALCAARPQASLYGIDIAKTAVRMAARRHQQACFAVASAYDLPLLDDSIDLVMRVFAPSDDAEMRRVMAPGAYYLEITPASTHLWELRERLYKTPRHHAVSRREFPGLSCARELEVSYKVVLDNTLLHDLVAMTPFAHRGHREKRAQLLQCDSIELGMAFSLCLFAAEASQDKTA